VGVDSEQTPIALSQRAYAKRRGVSHVAVQRAINSGRLCDSVCDGRIIDAELADREWDSNTDLTRAPLERKERAFERARKAAPALEVVEVLGPDEDAPPATDGMSMAEASRVEKVWKARREEARYKREVGELVLAKDVEREWADMLTKVRTKVLGLPAQMKSSVPTLSVAELATIEGLARECLEDLAGDGE